MPDLLYNAYRIRLLSQLKNGVWYPEALVLADTATGSVGTPIYGYAGLFDERRGGQKSLDPGQSVDR